MKTTKLKWRLSNLPTSNEIIALIANKIITQEEAREILFSEETQEDRNKESLKSEIKFLRELVEQLSRNRKEIVERIRYVEKPYYKWDWWNSYATWCTATPANNISVARGVWENGSTSTAVVSYPVNNSFVAIKTF